MSLAIATSFPGEPDQPFPSLSALRTAHSDLLKRQAAGGNTPGFLASVEDFLRRGQQTGALLDAPEDRWSAQSALDYWASALYRFGRQEVDPVLAEFDPALAPRLEDELCPYVGLEAFQESQHELFFGRSRLIDEMVSCLQTNRLLAALGPSGSGKSSLFLGGVVPALKSGALAGSESWRYFPRMMPGSEPLKNLARALLPADVDVAKWTSQQVKRLERHPEQLSRLVAEQSDRPAVLVIDQFEEVFTLCEDNDARQAFIANLLGLLRIPEPQHRVILTMRSDYEPFVTRLQDFQSYFDRGQLRVTPLSAAELRDAIEKPAERIGLKFEDGVVPALLEDILGEPAGLPLLQFTLLKLWESRERNRITWAAYRRLGGGRLALARSADALYDSLIPENQVVVRRILLRMVRPGSGLEVVNNRIRKDSLYQLGHDPGQIDHVLETLIKGRLVRLTPGETSGDAQIEVAHEALVRNWPLLVDWLEEARVEMTTRRRWEARAAEWVRLGRGQGGLLDEVQLLEAEHWLKSDAAKELGYDEQLLALVKASREAVERAAQEKRRRTLLRWGALVGLALYFLGWAGFAWKVRQTRIVEAAQKKVSDLQSEKTKLLSETRDLRSKLHALRAQAIQDSQNAERKMLQATQEIARATQQMEQAQLQAKHAAEVARRARLDIQNTQGEKDEAEQELSRAQQQILSAYEARSVAYSLFDSTERELRAAEDRVASAESTLAASQSQLALVQQHQETLEKNLADGGGMPQDTIEGLFRNIMQVIGERFEQNPFQKKHRPIRPGTSVSNASEERLAGTLCCLVRDSAGQKYLLSRTSVFGPVGTQIVQPSSAEFGTLQEKRNIVAEVVRVGSDPNRSGALARLASGVRAEPVVPRLGRIEGIADSVTVGTKVLLVGRGSGIQEREIIRIDEDGTIVTNFVPAPGDSGGPVLTQDRKLVGMLWGWSVRGKESYVTPIRQVLAELDVELVEK